MNAVAYQFAILEMFETLQYLKRTWERDGRIDQINMDHVNKALALATPVLTKATEALK